MLACTWTMDLVRYFNGFGGELWPALSMSWAEHLIDISEPMHVSDDC